MRKRYLELKDVNDHLAKQLDRSQQELDAANIKKTELEEVHEDQTDAVLNHAQFVYYLLP